MAKSRLTFPRRMRLIHEREFAAVFGGRAREERRPIAVHGCPNERGHCRLGLSVSKRGGTAVTRNRIKRLIREAFRLLQHEFPGSYDLVVAARPHAPRELSWYQQALRECVESIDRKWKEREAATTRRGRSGMQPDS
jgi:ribonuclease P protein component